MHMADTNKLLIYRQTENREILSGETQGNNYRRYRKDIAINRLNQIIKTQFINKYCTLKAQIRKDKRNTSVKLLYTQDSS